MMQYVMVCFVYTLFEVVSISYLLAYDIKCHCHFEASFVPKKLEQKLVTLTSISICQNECMMHTISDINKIHMLHLNILDGQLIEIILSVWRADHDSAQCAKRSGYWIPVVWVINMADKTKQSYFKNITNYATHLIFSV